MFIIFAFMFVMTAIPCAMVVGFSRSIDRDIAISSALTQSPASPAALAQILAAFAQADFRASLIRFYVRNPLPRHARPVARCRMAWRPVSEIGATETAPAPIPLLLRARKAIRWAVACSPVLRGLRRLARPVFTREIAMAAVTVALVIGAGLATIASLTTTSAVASAMVRK